ncbi:MAG: hypothetical protein NXI11_13960, partial [Proteobacteria bacterium]|nr:hypothetical protein [Pseudomonadota bacterium]
MTLVYLLTVAALDENGGPATLRFANGDYHEDGENWPPRLIKPILFAERARATWLRSDSTSRGDVEIDNSDGRFDYILDYALDGRALTLQTWDGATLTTVVRGTVSRVEVTRTVIRLILRDRAEVYNRPHSLDTYAGDGSDLEGSSDIAGRAKPKVFGSVSNATPVEVDFGLQIYQVSSLSDCTITAARDRGVALTDEGEYASQADLLDVAQTP